MKNTSYIIMWLTMFLVLILAMVLGLVLLLLADLYSSPLTRRRLRRRQVTTPTAADTITTTGNNSSTHSPSALHSHVDPLTDIEKQLPESSSSPGNQETGGTQRQHIQKGCLISDSVNGSSLVYISNPIYGDGNCTPFETPESSPSRLETSEDSSGDDERGEVLSKVVITPAMKKLPAAVTCSVCRKDVGSLGTSGSDTNGVSSSCSFTPCTSPSLRINDK